MIRFNRSGWDSAVNFIVTQIVTTISLSGTFAWNAVSIEILYKHD